MRTETAGTHEPLIIPGRTAGRLKIENQKGVQYVLTQRVHDRLYLIRRTAHHASIMRARNPRHMLAQVAMGARRDLRTFLDQLRLKPTPPDRGEGYRGCA